MTRWRSPVAALAAVAFAATYAATLGAAIGAAPLGAQARPARSVPVQDLHVEVTVGRAQVEAARLDVTATFVPQASGAVLLSMPVWTPGAYEVADYARGVMAFEAQDAAGALRWDKLDPDTWRIRVMAGRPVTVRYRVAADRLDVAGSWTAPEFAFFNGTNVLMYVEGRPETPATLTVTTEADWRVTTSMPTDGADTPAHRFRAADVHAWFDHPVFVGRYDLDSARVGDRWMRLATWPAGAVAGPRRAALWDGLSRSVEPLAAVFGEIPWERYTVLQVVHDEIGGMAALEHADGELALVGTPFLDEPFVLGVHAHELAHAWNVKRLRPADLLPYRYDAAQPTSWLWVSEGITDYYADLALRRGGLSDETAFLAATLAKIDGVDDRPATALEDASLQAWLGMRDGTGDLYYDKGSLAGFALDILIRDASDNRRSLDHVMRELYDGAYRSGRGFTHDDFWNAVARATRGRAWGDFERRYIDGREPYPWADWLPRAGWRLVQDSIREPRLGVRLQAHPQGVLVTGLDPEGMAAKAGVELGDVLVEIGGRPTRDPDFGRAWREVWGQRPGAPVGITLRRGDETLQRTARVEIDTRLERRIEPDPAASAKARRIRTGILEGLPRP